MALTRVAPERLTQLNLSSPALAVRYLANSTMVDFASQ
jgi:hypothetical protein